MTTTALGTVTTHATRDIPSLLAAVGLAHDLGNPPFGHQGEKAIRRWIQAHIPDDTEVDWNGLSDAEKSDFLAFEGNAQTFRLVSRVQNLSDKRGLNLTYSTLAALLKYPCTAAKTDDNKPACKKVGVFMSELPIAEEVWGKTGLVEGKRHPLTWIVEACDDIAYSVMDVEDSVKKGIISFADVVDWIEQNCETDDAAAWVVSCAKTDHQHLRKLNLAPQAIDDLSMQKLRVFAVSAMVAAVRTAFIENFAAIEDLTFNQELVKASKAAALCKALKNLASKRAYNSRGVLEIELRGERTIHSLMNMLWKSILRQREPFERYVYFSRISENYRLLLSDSPTLSEQLHLLCDMVAGMTDSFAGSLETELKQLSPSPRETGGA